MDVDREWIRRAAQPRCQFGPSGHLRYCSVKKFPFNLRYKGQFLLSSVMNFLIHAGFLFLFSGPINRFGLLSNIKCVSQRVKIRMCEIIRKFPEYTESLISDSQFDPFIRKDPSATRSAGSFSRSTFTG